MRPIIGITCSFDEERGRPRACLNAAYTDAVYAAGGVPFPIAPPPDPSRDLLFELLSRCDGLVFSGGDDLDPKHYGESRHARTQVMHGRRDRFELDFFRTAAERDVPTLSICLGCQIANVACGGKLIQHVDDVRRSSPVAHYRDESGSAYHAVRVAPESRLAQLTGRIEFEVNSRHHQLLDPQQVGAPLHAVAFAPDGVVEAVEDHTRRFMVAVQWHPEDLIDRREHLALFEGLVTAARR